ncbi:hypothetical protein SCLCIDRAFT_1216551 [Scleroderma citrinum Foug A]|uniref:Uncharacterized protein n=1 Tax=Scleroderma citrinum Foug A TaxID=1036808 RepID=A0A0C2ZGP3_9AGAM|nr:hypothetical protein SCLCIDRAFT_1216551 [Scleroderma citrinum Foug A]
MWCTLLEAYTRATVWIPDQLIAPYVWRRVLIRKFGSDRHPFQGAVRGGCENGCTEPRQRSIATDVVRMENLLVSKIWYR